MKISLTKTFFFDFSKTPLSNDLVDKEINTWLRKSKVQIETIDYDMGESYLFVNLFYNLVVRKA